METNPYIITLNTFRYLEEKAWSYRPDTKSDAEFIIFHRDSLSSPLVYVYTPDSDSTHYVRKTLDPSSMIILRRI